MDQPRLRIEDEEVGLRHLGDNLFEPKNLSILKQVINNEDITINKPQFFIKPIPIREPETYYKIESFCFVSTDNIKEEAELLLRSL